MTLTLPPIDRDELVATRRDLHRHPELGFEETRTSTLVAERVRALGYEVRTGLGTTGVVALRRGGGGRTVLLRADMDALPIEEASAVPYRSQHPGRMHACGHDGHVAIGLEAARRLAGVALPGSLKLVFQPAEELSSGAEALIRDGVLEDPPVDAAFGLHLWNELPVGTIGIMPGPIMASVDELDIAITGPGGHAAAPHQTVDPVVVAAHLVTALQSLVARRRDPLEAGVLSITRITAGHAYNVIPARAELRGTVRTFGGRFREEVPALVEQTARGIAQAFGASVEVRYRRLLDPVVNDERMALLMSEVAAGIVGPDNVRTGVRTMGGEDMSCFLARAPGCFAFVGSAPRDRPGAPHHSPTFDIEEESLVIGAELLTRAAVRFLERGTRDEGRGTG